MLSHPSDPIDGMTIECNLVVADSAGARAFRRVYANVSLDTGSKRYILEGIHDGVAFRKEMDATGDSGSTLRACPLVTSPSRPPYPMAWPNASGTVLRTILKGATRSRVCSGNWVDAWDLLELLKTNPVPAAVPRSRARSSSPTRARMATTTHSWSSTRLLALCLPSWRHAAQRPALARGHPT